MSLAGRAAPLLVSAFVVACGTNAQSDTPTPAPSTESNASPTATPVITISQQEYPGVRTITVQAKANVLGREIAYLSISINVRGPDVHTALDRAEEVTRQIRSVVGNLDVGTEIHDEAINSYPAAYGYPASAYRTISVETPNADDLSHQIGLLDERIRGGILTGDESVYFYVGFEIEEGGPAEQHARSKAIANARAAAEQIAAENGLTLGEILSVVEGSAVELSFSAPSYGPGPVPAGGGSASGLGGGYLQAQETEPVVTITVTFAVR